MHASGPTDDFCQGLAESLRVVAFVLVAANVFFADFLFFFVSFFFFRFGLVGQGQHWSHWFRLFIHYILISSYFKIPL